MKVRELLESETLRQYVNRLKRQGIKQLGSGTSAYIFQHPTLPNVAVKLLYGPDPGYIAYTKFCQTEGKNNPYCLKILDVTKDSKAFVGKNDPALTLVFSEKLSPITESEYKKFLYSYGYSPSWTDNIESMAKQRKDNHLAEIASALMKIQQKRLGNFDLHKDNFMRRGKQIVFVDPIT